MTSGEDFRGLSMPASLLVSRPPDFPVYDQDGVVFDARAKLDPQIDPVVLVHPRDANALLRWGEGHAASILFDDGIALWERQFFLQRGLTLEASRLYKHRGRFDRLYPLIEVLQSGAAFLAQQPSTYAAALSMQPADYRPEAHAVGTGLLAAGLMATTSTGELGGDLLMAPLLAGMVGDVGLVESHRDLLSFDRAMTPPERNILNAHPHSSSRIVRHFGIGSDRLLSAVEHHHERIDGSGYPLGLGGDSVSRLAQYVGTADTFLTLVTERLRSGAVHPDAAIEVMSNGAFATDLVDALAKLVAVRSRTPGDATAAIEAAA